MYRVLQYCLFLLCSSLLLVGQTTTREKPSRAGKPAVNANQPKDIDPLALKVLKAVSDPIRDAQTFSYRTRATREYVGSNGQIITYFTTSEVTVGRPNKLRVDFKGRGHDVQLYYDGGQAVLYAPGPKLYAVIPAAKTLDGLLEQLEKRNVFLPGKDLLASDPYQRLAPDLKTGYVIGRVQMYGKPVHQLAFTEKDAEYQLWVTGEPNPRIQALQVINMALGREPRVMIEFSDWNLNCPIQPDTFTFNKPADAKQIDFLKFQEQGR
jgi:hypothetical protein